MSHLGAAHRLPTTEVNKDHQPMPDSRGEFEYTTIAEGPVMPNTAYFDFISGTVKAADLRRGFKELRRWENPEAASNVRRQKWIPRLSMPVDFWEEIVCLFWLD